MGKALKALISGVDAANGIKVKKKKKKVKTYPVMVGENLVPCSSDPSILVHVPPDHRVVLDNVVKSSTLSQIYEWGKSIEEEEYSVDAVEERDEQSLFSAHVVFAPSLADVTNDIGNAVVCLPSDADPSAFFPGEHPATAMDVNLKRSCRAAPRQSVISGSPRLPSLTLSEGQLGQAAASLPAQTVAAAVIDFQNFPAMPAALPGQGHSEVTSLPQGQNFSAVTGLPLGQLASAAALALPAVNEVNLPAAGPTCQVVRNVNNSSMPAGARGTSLPGSARPLPLPVWSLPTIAPAVEAVGSLASTRGKAIMATSGPLSNAKSDATGAFLPNGVRILDSPAGTSCVPSIAGHKKPHQNADLPAPKKTYAEVFEGSRLEAKGLKLQFVEQNGEEVELDAGDEVPFVETWGFCLIGCFTGPFPGRGALNDIVKRWGVKCKILPYGRGWTIFSFMTEDDRIKVFHGGPYMAFGKTLMLKLVDKGTMLSDDLFVNIPVWVILRNVPLSVWSASGLSKIASRIGKPLYTDQFTKERSKMSYARVLVEVDVSKEPVMEFSVKLPDNRRYVQKVHYENYPDFCFHCTSFGHNHFKCKKLLKDDVPLVALKLGGVPGKVGTKGTVSNPALKVGTLTTGYAFEGAIAREKAAPPTQNLLGGKPKGNAASVLGHPSKAGPKDSKGVPSFAMFKQAAPFAPFAQFPLGGGLSFGGFSGVAMHNPPFADILDCSDEDTTLAANTDPSDWQEVTSKKNQSKNKGKGISPRREGALNPFSVCR